jgi:opacity protein-like surface antigen
MKKKIHTILLCLVIISLTSAMAWTQEIGVLGAWRTVADEQIKDTYGSGGVIFFPYLALGLSPKLSVGVGYEAGYKKTAQLGIFQESATLSVQGFEIFANYHFTQENIIPYLHFGVGFYSFKQEVDSTYVDTVEEKMVAMTVGGGVKYFLGGGFFAGVEIKYVPMEIKPSTIAVNMGGIRAGIHIGFDLQKR